MQKSTSALKRAVFEMYGCFLLLALQVSVFSISTGPVSTFFLSLLKTVLTVQFAALATSSIRLFSPG